MGFRDSHPRALAKSCQAGSVATWTIACKEKRWRFASTAFSVTCLSEIFGAKFEKSAEFFDLVRNQIGPADAKKRR
jgi:hypothetical protein